jgi:nucleotide-binding universal stress UspA family protein
MRAIYAAPVTTSVARRARVEDLVVAVDGSAASLSAVEWSAREAGSLRRGLRLVHVIGWPHDGSGPEADEAAALSAEILSEAAARAAAVSPGLQVGSESCPGRLGPTLLQKASRAHTLVLGYHQRAGYAGMVLGSVSVGVATHAAGPVVVVPEPAPYAWRPTRPEVVVGVDGGPASRHALAYAFDHAARHGYEVEAVVAGLERSMAEAVDASVAEVAQTYRLVPWRKRCTRGGAVESLTGLATDAALLVVGCRNRSGERSPLLTSVSRGAIFLARCPVAVV